jgi:RNA polymerase sigma-70 factor (ECF subfamily)
MDVSDSDLELIRRSKTGDTAAFDVIMQRYNRKAYQVIFGLVRNHADAEDLLQDTFLRAYENIARFDERYRFYTWLYRIAVNLCFTHLKRRKAAPQSLTDDEGETTDVPDERRPELSANVDRRHAIERALAELPAEQRLAMVLRTYEELSYAEIAEVMKTSIGTVMSRLSRARDKLRAGLKNYMAGG